jgi:RNA polymerase sigma-70 factor (ECF subfamily)
MVAGAEQSDWQLLDAWRAGDKSAGEGLVNRYFPAVSRFFRGKLGDDVDDPIQETFLACVASKERIEGASFRAYLFGVARRRLYEELRRRYKVAEPDFSISSLADLGTSPSETIARDQRAQILYAALAQIPVEAQIALELRYWEGLSGAEIAVALDIEEATVRSRLTRARQKLRKAVEALGGDAGSLFETDDSDL